jgi:TNF receptor-associated protein 1
MSTMEKHQFQAEIQQLLNIVIHSLYTDKEIFVRELISNAADALEKLRFLQSSGQSIHQPDLSPKITVETDDKANTVIITDTGIGMSNTELVENLGTIAHSGSKAFLKQLGTDKKPDLNLIGQFGVGFYSAFMVANKVEVFTRSSRTDESGWHWTSDGAGGYEIEPAADLPRGTRIILHLKPEETSFAKPGFLEQIIRRYSNFVPFPIELNSKLLNTVQAIWTRSKNQITDAEYNEFYHYIGHDEQDPILRLHFTADAPLAIQSLLYVPAKNLESTGFGRNESEVNLYCRKVLIQPRAKGLFPEWLRFLKGVVDSEDLPLNISRETMQDSSLMQKLNKVLTGKFIKFLEETAEKSVDTYSKFYEEYNRFIKEGIANDYSHRDSLGKLLRYESSSLKPGEKTSLAEYVKRMATDQKEIYYLLTPSREAAESSPYYEVFRARNFEVLFLFDAWDEFVMESLRAFDGKDLKAAEKAELEIESKPVEGALTEEQATQLTSWLKETLGDKVTAVRASKRLSDSPAVIVDKDQMLTASMRRMLKAMKQPGAETPQTYDLEINPSHSIITRLNQTRESNPGLAAQVAEQLLDNARVAAGILEDPRSMLKRLNELLDKVLAPQTITEKAG